MALTQEKAILERMRHPGIVGCQTLFEWDEHVYLVLEFIRGQVLERVELGPRATAHNLASVVSRMDSGKAMELRNRFRTVPSGYPPRPTGSRRART